MTALKNELALKFVKVHCIFNRRQDLCRMNEYNYRRVHESYRVGAMVILLTALSCLEYTQWRQGQQHHMGVKGVWTLRAQPPLRVSSEGHLGRPLGNDRVIYNDNGMPLHVLYRAWTLSHRSSQANCHMTNGYCSRFSNVILSSSGFSLCLLLFFPFGVVASSRTRKLATSCRAISSSMAMPTIYGEEINFQVFSPSPHSLENHMTRCDLL